MSLEAEVTQRLADEAAAGRGYADFSGHHQRVNGLYAARLDRGAVRPSPVQLRVYGSAGATFLASGVSGDEIGYRSGSYGSVSPSTFTVGSTQYSHQNLFVDDSNRIVWRLNGGAQVTGWSSARLTFRGVGSYVLTFGSGQYAVTSANGVFAGVSALQNLWVLMEDAS